MVSPPRWRCSSFTITSSHECQPSLPLLRLDRLLARDFGVWARRARASRLRGGRETDLGGPLPPLPFPSILRIERHRPLRLFDLRGRDATCPPHARCDQAKRAPHASRLACPRRLADRNHRKLGKPNAAEPVTTGPSRMCALTTKVTEGSRDVVESATSFR